MKIVALVNSVVNIFKNYFLKEKINKNPNFYVQVFKNKN